MITLNVISINFSILQHWFAIDCSFMRSVYLKNKFSHMKKKIFVAAFFLFRFLSIFLKKIK